MKTAIIALLGVAFTGAVSVEVEAEQFKNSRRPGRNDQFNSVFERVTGRSSPLRDNGRFDPRGSRGIDQRGRVIDSKVIDSRVIDQGRVIDNRGGRVIDQGRVIDNRDGRVIDSRVIKTEVIQASDSRPRGGRISAPIVEIETSPVIINDRQNGKPKRGGKTPERNPKSVVRQGDNKPPTRGGHADGPFLDYRQHRALYPFMHIEHDFDNPI